jgi:hypothetical protein
MVQSHPTDGLNFKGLTGIFSTSLRRGSPFSVEIMGTHGFINIKDPANCPYSSVVNVGPDAYSSSTSASGIITQFPVKEICQKVRRIVLIVSPLTPHLSRRTMLERMSSLSRCHLALLNLVYATRLSCLSLALSLDLSLSPGPILSWHHRVRVCDPCSRSLYRQSRFSLSRDA